MYSSNHSLLEIWFQHFDINIKEEKNYIIHEKKDENVEENEKL